MLNTVSKLFLESIHRKETESGIFLEDTMEKEPPLVPHAVADRGLRFRRIDGDAPGLRSETNSLRLSTTCSRTTSVGRNGKADFDPEFKQHESEERDHFERLATRLRELRRR